MEVCVIELLFHKPSFVCSKFEHFCCAISAVFVKNFSASTATLIRHSQQFQFVTWCKMDFTFYPFDTQVIQGLRILFILKNVYVSIIKQCPSNLNNKIYLTFQKCWFRIRSYSHTRDQMAFKLHQFIDETQGSATVLDYHVKLTKLDDHNITSLENKVYSNVGFMIELQRYSSKYFINYYVPSIIFVVVSWVSFMIPPDNVPGRMGLLVTLLLVLINQFGSVVNSQPPNESPTAITIWFLACKIFVALALVAYAFILFKKMKFKKHSRNKIFDVKSHCNFRQPKHPDTKTQEQFEQEIAALDNKFLLLLPTAFLFCNLGYWSIVLTLTHAQKH